MNIRKYLDAEIEKALASQGASGCPAITKQAQRVEFGQYQANGVMGAAKKLKIKPHDLARQVVDNLNLDCLQRV